MPKVPIDRAQIYLYLEDEDTIVLDSTKRKKGKSMLQIVEEIYKDNAE